FNKDGQLTNGEITLTRHTDFSTKMYKERFLKPNPYTTQERIVREEPPDETPWPGFEYRPGWADLKKEVMERDGMVCRLCKTPITPETCEVDHIIPYSRFKRPIEANRPKNLWTLCIPCHRGKTESERRMESRMQ